MSQSTQGLGNLQVIDSITQIVNGTQSTWNTLSIPVPKSMVVYAADTTAIKIGDGETLYAELPVIATLSQLLQLATARPGCAQATWPGGAVVINGTVEMIMSAPSKGSITSLDFKTGTGSFIVTVLVNGTPVPGLVGITVNNPVKATQVATSLTNAFSQGDEITVVITGCQGNPTAAALNLNVTWSVN
jgi:hypothetical protein